MCTNTRDAYSYSGNPDGETLGQEAGPGGRRSGPGRGAPRPRRRAREVARRGARLAHPGAGELSRDF